MLDYNTLSNQLLFTPYFFSSSSSNSTTKQSTSQTTGTPLFMFEAGAYGHAKRSGLGSTSSECCGEDSFFISEGSAGLSRYVGVADGVGGWNAMGVDPSFMSKQMMRNSSSLASQAANSGVHVLPSEILSRAYSKIVNGKEVEAGSTTTCVLSISHSQEGKPILHSANLGDSGFMVIRGTEVVMFSEFQRQDNAPRQLAMIPERFKHIGAIQSSPDEAEVLELEIQEGDVIICATDGLWDNIPRDSSWKGVPYLVAALLEQDASLRDVAKVLVDTAVSTFYKPDDVTVVAVRVVKPNVSREASS